MKQRLEFVVACSEQCRASAHERSIRGGIPRLRKGAVPRPPASEHAC